MKLRNTHPGEILLNEFMQPVGLSQYALAHALNVPPIRISEIVRGKRAISADTALRLSKYWGTSAQFWLNLQADYDLVDAEDRIEEELTEIISSAHPSSQKPEAK